MAISGWGESFGQPRGHSNTRAAAADDDNAIMDCRLKPD